MGATTARLRVIDDGPGRGAVNMRRDRELWAAHRPGDEPVLRLYRWAPPAVSIGYHQDPHDFDAAALANAGYDLVRRPTGGRAILHAAELTYSVIGSSPSPLFGDSLHTTYQRINTALLAFLESLGITADIAFGETREQMRAPTCFASAGRYEIRVNGRKLVGSAQRRGGGTFLQHGSILTGPDHSALARFLSHRAAASTHGVELAAATTDLGRLLGRRRPTDADYRDWSARLIAAFAASFKMPPVTVAAA